jgi:hypothetical protein
MKTLDERKKEYAIASDNLTAYWREGKRDLERFNKLVKLYKIASGNITNHPDYEEPMHRQVGEHYIRYDWQAGIFRHTNTEQTVR